MSDWKENVTGKAPVNSDDMVVVKLRDGEISSPHNCDWFDWSIEGVGGDIVLWKLSKTQTETPEKKEAFDSMENNLESPNGSEWDGKGLPPVGAECEKIFDGKSQVITPIHYDNHYECMVMFYYCDSGTSISQRYDWCLVENCIFRKPETPQHREERERLEAAYDLYIDYTEDDDCYSFPTFCKLTARRKWLSIVDKTGYRKAK